MRRARSFVLAAAAALLQGACAGPTPTLQGAIEGLGEKVGGLLGASSLPGKYVDEIQSVHEDDNSWRFRPEASKPLERTCDAVRGLATADYGSWGETARVVWTLTMMSDVHPSALVRAECLDTLAAIHVWTAAAVGPTDRTPTDVEANAAIDTIGRIGTSGARGDDAATDLADALNVVAAYRFDRADPLPQRIDLRVLGRGARSHLSTTRKILRVLTSGAFGELDADVRVRDALDRAYVGTCASAIRLALVTAAAGAKEDIVRTAAVRDIERAHTDQAPAILGAILAQDDQSSVRREAARALGSFPEKDSVPLLLPALADDRFEVRASAAASLAAVTGQTFGDDRRAWAAWWKGRAGAAGTDATDGAGGADGGANTGAGAK